MKFWFDTEFIEDGKTIDLVSIGILAEDGRTYYAEAAECDHSRADGWVRENVLSNLDGGDAIKPRAQIASDIVAFVGDKPEFWAYYADYDWVVLCQLYGRMIDIPKGWPKVCMDFRQWLDANGLSDIKQPEDHSHHALDDARWLAQIASRHGAQRWL